MDPVEYWRSRAMESSQEYEQLLQSQRDEIESLQRRCNDLLHERSMMKAATAADVRNFCLNYQADQQRRKGLTSSSAVEDIPVHTLMQFLHTYSNGLLPAPENVRKRYRGRDEVATTSTAAAPAGSAASSSATPAPTASPHRLYQRMLARQRATGRLEEYQEEHAALLEAQRLKQQQYKMEQQQHLDPQCGSSSGDLDVSAADAQPLQQQQPQQRHTVESQEEEDARRAAARSSRGGGGGGGPVVSASAPDYL